MSLVAASTHWSSSFSNQSQILLIHLSTRNYFHRLRCLSPVNVFRLSCNFFPVIPRSLINSSLMNEPWLQLSSIAYVLNIFVEFFVTNPNWDNAHTDNFSLISFSQASTLSILTFPDIKLMHSSWMILRESSAY